MEKILIIDDDCGICAMLSVLIRRTGCEAVCRQTLEEGLITVHRDAYAVVLLDVQMPDGSGLDRIADIRRASSGPEVIIMTGFGNADGAEIAIKSGVWDYIQKSGSTQEITLSLNRALAHHREKVQRRARPVALTLGGIVGESKPMKACYDQLAQAAAGETNVLITGETGTGKEVFARAIHANSGRSAKSMVVVDCAAMPETLVESLLFGHEKGAYTGADSRREGLVAQADGGTLFLDEVGELPLTIQKVFLRVLQERRYRPVGARQERSSDFRLIAATNRDLDQMVAEGRFRKDLLYRIRGLGITLPALRERKEDIRPLARQCARNDQRRGNGSGQRRPGNDFGGQPPAARYPLAHHSKRPEARAASPGGTGRGRRPDPYVRGTHPFQRFPESGPPSSGTPIPANVVGKEPEPAGGRAAGFRVVPVAVLRPAQTAQAVDVTRGFARFSHGTPG